MTLPTAAALLLLLAMGCAAAGQPDCPEGMDGFIELKVYFGREQGDGSVVSEAEWQDFLAETVTPQFPDGLTVFDAKGQWFDASQGRLYQESTKVLNVLAPADASDAALASARRISDAYKERFNQQAVFHTARPACAAVY